MAKRRELARHNYKHDKMYGKSSREGMDASHVNGSGIRYKPSSVNRGSKTDMAGDSADSEYDKRESMMAPFFLSE